MTYKVIAYFEDLQDDNRPYRVGDVYPRKGYTPSKRRIDELATNKNVRGAAVIAVDFGEPKKK